MIARLGELATICVVDPSRILPLKVQLSVLEMPRSNTVRRLGIILSWVIWIAAPCAAIFGHKSQLYVVAMWLLGFVPYLIALQVIEPWLLRRAASRRGAVLSPREEAKNPEPR